MIDRTHARDVDRAWAREASQLLKLATVSPRAVAPHEDTDREAEAQLTTIYRY
jgi:hypothetical protein